MTLSPFIQKLLFVNQFGINDGIVNLMGDRYILLNAKSILSLQEIDKTKVYNTAKKAAKKDLSGIVEHAEVYKNLKTQELKNIAELSKKIGKNDDGVIKTLEMIFNIYGLGKLNIVNLDNEHKKAQLKIINSTIGQEHLKIEKKSKNPVCAITSGILAGIFSYIFNKDVECAEKSCIGKGDESCQFEVS
jgi:predicted hydrocarbon binding protein